MTSRQSDNHDQGGVEEEAERDQRDEEVRRAHHPIVPRCGGRYTDGARSTLTVRYGPVSASSDTGRTATVRAVRPIEPRSTTLGFVATLIDLRPVASVTITW